MLECSGSRRAWGRRGWGAGGALGEGGIVPGDCGQTGLRALCAVLRPYSPARAAFHGIVLIPPAPLCVRLWFSDAYDLIRVHPKLAQQPFASLQLLRRALQQPCPMRRAPRRPHVSSLVVSRRV